ncbi:GNAT family N-acetyltransferase [Agromyces sp. SYSU T00194]|uniref:GNAT family N-acetyltransferase n=1 Tax=Agromyces chitinivorans TaxID=3158560 RepID=UPI0033993194
MSETPAPLSERVAAPTELRLPSHPLVVDWHPVTGADHDALVALDHAIGTADHPNYLPTREEVLEEYDISHVEPALDSLIGYDADGRAIAHGLVVCPPGRETLVRSILFGGVHPDARGLGIGRELLAWQVGRARQQLAASDARLPGWIVVYADDRATRTGPMVRRAGFAPARYFLGLERVLADPIDDGGDPDGVRLAPYDPSFSEAALAARNDAFRDHWGSQSMSAEQWSRFTGSDVFRADLSVVAADADGRVAGFVLAEVNEEDWARQGFSGTYVGLVGVVRDARGRGIARALLARHLDAARAAGLERSVLDVDSDSPTGALGLYTGMGYAPTQRETSYTIVL